MTVLYGRLVELANREADLIAAERYDDLTELDGERTRLTELLPATPPAEARPFLEQAAALQQANSAALLAALGATQAEILELSGHRHAARSYAPPAASGSGALLDRRAG